MTSPGLSQPQETVDGFPALLRHGPCVGLLTELSEWGEVEEDEDDDELEVWLWLLAFVPQPTDAMVCTLWVMPCTLPQPTCRPFPAWLLIGRGGVGATCSPLGFVPVEADPESSGFESQQCLSLMCDFKPVTSFTSLSLCTDL